MFRLSSWKAGRLLLAWAVYWVGLALITVAPAIPILWKLSGSGAKGSSSVSFGDGGLLMSVTVNATQVWSQTIPLSLMAVWIAVPPLVLWALWLRAQTKRRDVELRT